MNYAVTLKSLRKAKACVPGYNKLVSHLSGKEFNSERETYVRFKHDEPISILSILESNGLDDALWAAKCVEGADCDLRLFAAWCARQVQHLMTDDRSTNAIDTAERYANGKATDAELEAAKEAAWEAAREAAWEADKKAARSADKEAARSAARYLARSAAWAATRSVSWDAAREAAWAAAKSVAWDATWDAQRKMFVRMLNGTAPWQAGEKK